MIRGQKAFGIGQHDPFIPPVDLIGIRLQIDQKDRGIVHGESGDHPLSPQALLLDLLLGRNVPHDDDTDHIARGLIPGQQNAFPEIERVSLYIQDLIGEIVFGPALFKALEKKTRLDVHIKEFSLSRHDQPLPPVGQVVRKSSRCRDPRNRIKDIRPVRPFGQEQVFGDIDLKDPDRVIIEGSEIAGLPGCPVFRRIGIDLSHLIIDSVRPARARLLLHLPLRSRLADHGIDRQTVPLLQKADLQPHPLVLFPCRKGEVIEVLFPERLRHVREPGFLLQPEGVLGIRKHRAGHIVEFGIAVRLQNQVPDDRILLPLVENIEVVIGDIDQKDPDIFLQKGL